MSCARVVGLVSGKNSKQSAKPNLAGLKAYENAGGRVTKSFDDIAAGNVATGVPLTTVGITPQEDIVWAPENPDEEIEGGLESLWKQPENVSWHTDYKTAIRQARETGKPVMIWFTNSARSPTCKSLSHELFSSNDFNNWASEKVIRLRLDEAGGANNSSSGGARTGGNAWTEQKNYYEKLKKKYKALGTPTVLILSPSGSSLAKYRGYKKGDRDYYWGRMKSAVSQAESDYGVWREKLEARGYRLWSNRQGRKIFAKLNRFKQDKVTLIEPDGKRGSTSLSKLSDADQAWILQEKKKYDQTRGR